MSRLEFVRFFPYLSLVLISESLLAAELGRIPGLQSGAGGQAIYLSELDMAEMELDFSSSQKSGTAKSGSEGFDGDGSARTLQFSYAQPISKEVRFFSYGSSTVTSYEQSPATDSGSHLESHGSRIEIGGGPTIRTENYILGAHASIAMIGKKQQTKEANAAKQTMETDGATLPFLTSYIGKRWPNADVVIAYKTFNSMPSKGVATNEGGQISRFDTAAKVPSEVRLETKFFPNERLLLAGGVRMLATGQASESVDDLTFSLEGLPAHVDQENHLEWEVGGVLKPQPWIGFIGALHMRQESFSSNEDASIEFDNLGGTAIDVGSILYSDVGKAYFNLGYQLPNKISYLKAADSQGTWVGPAESVDLRSVGWDIKIGLSLYL